MIFFRHLTKRGVIVIISRNGAYHGNLHDLLRLVPIKQRHKHIGTHDKVQFAVGFERIEGVSRFGDGLFRLRAVHSVCNNVVASHADQRLLDYFCANLSSVVQSRIQNKKRLLVVFKGVQIPAVPVVSLVCQCGIVKGKALYVLACYASVSVLVKGIHFAGILCHLNSYPILGRNASLFGVFSVRIDSFKLKGDSCALGKIRHLKPHRRNIYLTGLPK